MAHEHGPHTSPILLPHAWYMHGEYDALRVPRCLISKTDVRGRIHVRASHAGEADLKGFFPF